MSPDFDRPKRSPETEHHLTICLRRHRWKQVLGLGTTSILLAVVVAGIWWWGDQPHRESGETYATDGWYGICLVGTYLTGLGSLVLGIRRGWQRWRSLKRRSRDALVEEGTPA